MSRTYTDGIASEEAVVRVYLAQGATMRDKRWRCAAGEIDLIFQHGDTLIFVEVKHRRTTTEAAYAISARQWGRIGRAAEIYMAEKGFAPQAAMRFDAALTDSYGNVEIIENAAQFDE